MARPRGRALPESHRTNISAAQKASHQSPTRKTRWERLFRDALEKGDMETATAIMVEEIRKRLREAA